MIVSNSVIPYLSLSILPVMLSHSLATVVCNGLPAHMSNLHTVCMHYM